MWHPIKRLENWLSNILIKTLDKKNEKLFICYYCGNQFPITELEEIGPYQYCSSHGTERKNRFLNWMKEQRHA